MKIIFSVLLLSGFSTSALAAVEWGISQQGQVYCYPADSKGVISGAYPVSDSLCFMSYGAEWAKDTNGYVRCFPKKPAHIQSQFFNRPIANVYCR